MTRSATPSASRAEFPDPAHPAHAAATDHKWAVRGRLEALALAAGAEGPPALADALAVLMDGAYCGAQALGPSGPTRRVQEIATDLIARGCPSPPRA